MKERVKNLDWADRWFTDTVDCLHSGGFSLSCEIDMTQTAALLKNLRTDAYKSV